MYARKRVPNQGGVPPMGNFTVSVGVGTTDRFAERNCWNTDLSADLAEVIPIIILSRADISVLYWYLIHVMHKGDDLHGTL